MRRSGVDEQAEFEAAVKLCPPRVRSELVSRLDPAACHALLCERLEGFAEGRPPIRHKGQDAADPPTWRRVTAAALGAEEGCEPVALVRQWLIGVPQALSGDEEARATAEERAAQQRAREPHEEETAPADAAGQRRLALRGTPPAAPRLHQLGQPPLLAGRRMRLPRPRGQRRRSSALTPTVTS